MITLFFRKSNNKKPLVGAPSGLEGTEVKQVACGENHTVFLTEKGEVWTVGNNVDGQLGRGSRGEGSFAIYPIGLVGVEIVQVAAGRAHSMAVGADGRVFAWGSNLHGQLAMDSSQQWQETPKRIRDLMNVVQVSAGPDHCVALNESGHVSVWGEQFDGRGVHRPEVVEALNGVPIVRIVAGGRHCVAISVCGSVFTWGQNDSGQLGLGDVLPRGRVSQVHQMTGMGVIEASCGDAHTVLLTSTGKIFVFGSDVLGQCGFGKKTEKRTMPAAVDDLMGSVVTRIATGRCHTVAIVGGYAHAFGLNSSGQLGNGRMQTQSTPKRNDEMDRIAAVFAGWDQTFFIRAAHSEQHNVPGSSFSLKQPATLTKAKVEEAMKVGKMAVLELLENVFTSLSCLNGSFVFEDDRRFHFGAERGPGVDLDDAMEAFRILELSAAAKDYENIMIESLKMSLFNCNPGKFISLECLRALVFLPWMSAFTNMVTTERCAELHLHFANVINLLSQSHRNVLFGWLSKLQQRHFARFVNTFKSAVRAFVLKKEPPSFVTVYLDLLRLLYDINRKNKQIVPLGTFYIPEIFENYDLRLDYYYFILPMTGVVQATNYWVNYPFLLNGEAKVALLHVEAILSQQARVNSSVVQTAIGPLLFETPEIELNVRREHIVTDAMEHMHRLSAQELAKPLKITMLGEIGEDAGGVRKEFFLLVMQKILQPEYGMFVEDETSHLVWFSGIPEPMCERNQFFLLGRLCGLAVYNSVVFNFPFPIALYKMMLDEKPTLEDLTELSPLEGKSLQSLLDYESDDFESVFCLNFTITSTILGEPKTYELKPGGADIDVTLENRKEYVDLYVQHKLTQGPDGEIAVQFERFRKGFMDAVRSKFLSAFQPGELQELIVGSEDYDWIEMKSIAEYKGEYTADHPTIVAFWKAFYQLDEDERKKFLQFLTGSTRLPLAGMKMLKITIQPTAPEALPVAHTCFNLLDLPKIEDSEEILRRLRISIEHTQGFTLV